MASRRPRSAAADPQRTINLALQGGGAHGAFTWGVLDQLLEADALGIEAADELRELGQFFGGGAATQGLEKGGHGVSSSGRSARCWGSPAGAGGRATV